MKGELQLCSATGQLLPVLGGRQAVYPTAQETAQVHRHGWAVGKAVYKTAHCTAHTLFCDGGIVGGPWNRPLRCWLQAVWRAVQETAQWTAQPLQVD